MIDKPLLAAVMVLLTLSLVMDYSLSVYTVQHFGYNEFHFFMRQSIAVFAGLVMMVILSRLDPDRWILEFFKVGFIAFLAWSFKRKLGDKGHMSFGEEIRLFAPYLFIFMAVVVLVAIFQKDLGQVVVLGAALLTLFLFVGSSYKFFLMLLSSAFAAVIALIFLAPHRMARIKSWWISVQTEDSSGRDLATDSSSWGISRKYIQISFLPVLPKSSDLSVLYAWYLHCFLLSSVSSRSLRRSKTPCTIFSVSGWGC